MVDCDCGCDTDGDNDDDDGDCILSISQSAYDNIDEDTAILIDPCVCHHPSVYTLHTYIHPCIQASSLDSSSTSLPSTFSDV